MTTPIILIGKNNIELKLLHNGSSNQPQVAQCINQAIFKHKLLDIREASVQQSFVLFSNGHV